MKITEGKTKDQALKYFEEGRTMHRYIPDKAMNEVYAKAMIWKRNNVPKGQWGDYPLHEVCVSLILGEL